MASIKLTKAQQAVMDDLHRKREDFLACESFEDFAINCYSCRGFDSYEDLLKWEYRLGKKSGDRTVAYMHLSYERQKQDIFLTHASSHTLRALERRGLIEIIEDSAGASYAGVDVVKLLDI